MCLNHPETIPFPHLALKKLFPMKLLPGAKNVGDCWYKTFLTLRFFSAVFRAFRFITDQSLKVPLLR